MRGALVLCCAVLVAAPAVMAAPWGKRGTAKDTTVQGVDTKVVEEHTTIELPQRSRKSDMQADITDPSLLPAELPKTEYTIGPGDVLDFQSFDDPSLSRPGVVILYDGTISLPLIADLNVNGMTREQAEETIRAAYQDVFKDPQLS
ncbi:MAG: polysaccharide biosynthesis/export family protein [Candidatus Hydrogenedentes bacterium]|nr:polysaccharide biosynthesis/export family protein [Candidatus Hydrogenedentota bacterium]